MDKNNKNNNLNPVFVPYGLPIEDIKTLGEFSEIKSYSVPPYSLMVDKDKVPEINLEAPDNIYMDFMYLY